MPSKPATCPTCGGPLLPVIYGEPSPELGEAERRGEVILAGCIILGRRVKRACAACGLEERPK